MIGIVAIMVAIWLWERPSLLRWSRRERVAFWIYWAVGFAWALAVQAHAVLPTFPDLTNAIFDPWAKQLLTPHPDPFW